MNKTRAPFTFWAILFMFMPQTTLSQDRSALPSDHWQLSCELRERRIGPTLELRAVAIARYKSGTQPNRPAAGSYDLSVATSGSGGQSMLSSRGRFEFRTAGEQTLSVQTVSYGLGAQTIAEFNLVPDDLQAGNCHLRRVLGNDTRDL